MHSQGTTIEKDVVVVDDDQKEVVRKKSALYEPSDREKGLARLERFQTIGRWIVSAVSALLFARLLLSLFAANPAAGFASFVLAITTPLILPFEALFRTPSFGASVLDTAALVGLIVYPVVGYGAIRLLKAIMAPSDPTGRAYQ